MVFCGKLYDKSILVNPVLLWFVNCSKLAHKAIRPHSKKENNINSIIIKFGLFVEFSLLSIFNFFRMLKHVNGSFAMREWILLLLLHWVGLNREYFVPCFRQNWLGMWRLFKQLDFSNIRNFIPIFFFLSTTLSAFKVKYDLVLVLFYSIDFSLYPP